MELPSQEEEMPTPITSTYYGGEQMIHHDPSLIKKHHILPLSQILKKMPSSTFEENSQAPSYNKVVRYKECLKNHAASMGGNATDGCGEFMPSGEEGSLEALTCSACKCHRNFHRKETEGENSLIEYFPHYHHLHHNLNRTFILGHSHHKGMLGNHAVIPSRGAQPHQMIMSSYNYNIAPLSCDQSDELEDNGGGVIMARPIHQMVKKRFRTKFTHEQKEKMLQFAEKVNWKIQKQDESVVQQFCQEIGVKRRVLKVWMHNNKHNLAKKKDNIISNNQTPV
ncbi:hypothetical protein Leryth_017283 [Lithospermum erythrorhizon]|uniref:ZF-HD dimerization-type domain-containing protein n=1 Tax=Lithospermum erythrorhizon TaxID=34254 RepID=A0AAV3PDV1_LITER|nr:hypothetical protein Leryth_017283 [Lithospermum erythrorhizon]